MLKNKKISFLKKNKKNYINKYSNLYLRLNDIN